MSAPDPKTVEEAILLGQHCYETGDDLLGAPQWEALLFAARAYLRTPTAPQGAEPVYVPFVDEGPLLTNPELGNEPGLREILRRYYRSGRLEYPERWAQRYLDHMHAAPQGAEIARDAARYRWVRDRLAIEDVERMEREFLEFPVVDEAESKRTDAAIDAALTPTDAETKHGN